MSKTTPEDVSNELPVAERLELAVAAYLDSAEESKPSIRNVARDYGVEESTVRRRLKVLE